MKYDLVPQSLAEERILAAAPHLRVLLEPFLPLVTAHALLAFVRLGIPAALAGPGRSAAEIAVALELDPVGLDHLLRILEILGYVERTDDGYRLTALSRATLLDDAPAPLDAWVAHNQFHLEALNRLDGALREPGSRDLHHHLDSPDAWATYQRAMLQTAAPAAEAVARALPSPSACRTVLDLGGSHGLYGAAICRRFPGSRCRVLDLPEAVAHARALGRAAAIDEVVSWEESDLLTCDLGRGTCDVIFLGNVIHHLPEDDHENLLVRARHALRPGGVIAVWDLAVPATDDAADLVAAGFALLFHLTSAASCRPPERLVSSLEAAGFTATHVDRGIALTHALVSGRT